jgi:hypothetical protein
METIFNVADNGLTGTNGRNQRRYIAKSIQGKVKAGDTVLITDEMIGVVKKNELGENILGADGKPIPVLDENGNQVQRVRPDVIIFAGTKAEAIGMMNADKLLLADAALELEKELAERAAKYSVSRQELANLL